MRSYASILFLVSALLTERCQFQDNSKDVLPSPQVFSVNTNTVLVICRANVSGPFSSLQVKVKGNSSHKYLQDARKSYLTSYDDKTPLVTSRLLLEQYETKFKPTLITTSTNVLQHRQMLQAQFLCHDSHSGRRSKVTNVTVESGWKKTNSVSGFSPKRNRKRKAFVNKTVKFIWHHSNIYEEENSPSPSPCHKCVRCYHDGNLLEQSKVIINKSKVTVRLKNVNVHDTGFYWSEIKDSSNLTSVSSFVELRVIPTDEKNNPENQPQKALLITVFLIAILGMVGIAFIGYVKRKPASCGGTTSVAGTHSSYLDLSKPHLHQIPNEENQYINEYCNMEEHTVSLDNWSIFADEDSYQDVSMEVSKALMNTDEDSYKDIHQDVVSSTKRYNNDNENPGGVACVGDSSPLNRQNSSKSQQSNSSNFSSISEKLCPKPTLPDTIHPKLCAWGRFSEKGGRLTIQDTGVSLYVPKMALPKGTSQIIYIGLMNRKGLYPELDEGHAVLSPAVICGPDGLKFDKPVHITVPHNAVIDDGSSWAPQVHSCLTVPQKQDDVAEWKSMEDAENNEPPFVHMDKTSMQIMVNHFTGFVVVGQPTELKIWVVSFCTEPKVDLDCTVRVYCIPATKAALEELRVDETTLKGTEKDASKPLKIYNNRKNIVVRVVDVREGWNADEDNQSIPFEDVWQMSQSPTCFPNASFMFARNKDDQFSFSSGFIVKQDMDNATTVKLKVSTSIQRLTSESSGYSSFSPENGGRTDIEYKIPLERRRTLCYLLDVERTDFRDYRLFGEKLGLEKNFINWLKRTACTSPTNVIIEWWEDKKSGEIPVTKLIAVLNEMERDDAAEELKNI